MRKSEIGLVLVLFLFTITYFLLEVSAQWNTINLLNQVQQAIVQIVFCIIGAISLIILLFSKSGDSYYEPLKSQHLVAILAFAALMYLVGLICSALLQASEVPIKTISLGNSVITDFLSDILFTITVVALTEELMKFAGYTYFKQRYRRRGSFVMWCLALTPIFLWAAFHGITAYTNLWYLLPAVANGFLLLALLELTHSLWAPVLAHGLYNAAIICMTYVTQVSDKPLFPTTLSFDVICLLILCFLWVTLFLVPIVWRGRRKRR